MIYSFITYKYVVSTSHVTIFERDWLQKLAAISQKSCLLNVTKTLKMSLSSSVNVMV